MVTVTVEMNSINFLKKFNNSQRNLIRFEQYFFISHAISLCSNFISCTYFCFVFLYSDCPAYLKKKKHEMAASRLSRNSNLNPFWWIQHIVPCLIVHSVRFLFLFFFLSYIFILSQIITFFLFSYSLF